MQRVNIQEAKTTLSKLLAGIESTGEPVLICRYGRPIAQLGPLPLAPDPLQLHAELADGVVLHEDPALPLSEDDWELPEDAP